MRIVSTTQSHNAQDLIGDALRSVLPFVDACLLVDSGITDRTVEVARQVAGGKLIVEQFAWGNDFSRARNYHLDAAARLGFDWAVTLDTDERIEGLARSHFESVADTLFVAARDGSYQKQRCFRLPAKGRWVNPVHEAFIPDADCVQGVVASASFWEVPKSGEQLLGKFRRCVAILKDELSRDPANPRNWYYLGDALCGVGDDVRAIEAFGRCADLRGWNEESAWACYRAAECLVKAGKLADAVDWCARGMARHPGIAELPWLAAYTSHLMRDFQAAITWAQISASLGYYKGTGSSMNRIGFKHLPALFEGPYDVLRFALREVGDFAGAFLADMGFHEAVEERKDYVQRKDVRGVRDNLRADERSQQNVPGPVVPSVEHGSDREAVQENEQVQAIIEGCLSI